MLYGVNALGGDGMATATASRLPVKLRRCEGICEFVYTCMICFVALNVMSPKRNEKDMLRLKGLGCQLKVCKDAFASLLQIS